MECGCFQALDINDSGDIIGHAEVSLVPAGHLFLYSKGSMSEFSHALQGEIEYHSVMNNAGQAAVGTWIWDYPLC